MKSKSDTVSAEVQIFQTMKGKYGYDYNQFFGLKTHWLLSFKAEMGLYSIYFSLSLLFSIKCTSSPKTV